jgi:hypothetical protein
MSPAERVSAETEAIQRKKKDWIASSLALLAMTKVMAFRTSESHFEGFIGGRLLRI